MDGAARARKVATMAHELSHPVMTRVRRMSGALDGVIFPSQTLAEVARSSARIDWDEFRAEAMADTVLQAMTTADGGGPPHGPRVNISKARTRAEERPNSEMEGHISLLLLKLFRSSSGGKPSVRSTRSQPIHSEQLHAVPERWTFDAGGDEIRPSLQSQSQILVAGSCDPCCVDERSWRYAPASEGRLDAAFGSEASIHP